MQGAGQDVFRVNAHEVLACRSRLAEIHLDIADAGGNAVSKVWETVRSKLHLELKQLHSR